MKYLISFCALILLIGSAAPAHADYFVNIIAAPAGQPISSEPFNVALTPCPTSAANGCFFVQNATGNPITTLQIVFYSTGILQNQIGFDELNSLSLWQIGASESFIPAGPGGLTILFFDFGNTPIANTESFLIFERGVTFSINSDGSTNFPVGIASFPPILTVPPFPPGIVPSTVPEPNSIVLLSTAFLVGIFFFGRKNGLLPDSLRYR